MKQLQWSYKALAYIASRQVLLKSDQLLSTSRLALFDKAGELVQIKAKDDASNVLLAGEPIYEPITRRGLFIMNSESEIVETLRY